MLVYTLRMKEAYIQASRTVDPILKGLILNAMKDCCSVWDDLVKLDLRERGLIQVRHIVKGIKSNKVEVAFLSVDMLASSRYQDYDYDWVSTYDPLKYFALLETVSSGVPNKDLSISFLVPFDEFILFDRPGRAAFPRFAWRGGAVTQKYICQRCGNHAAVFCKKCKSCYYCSRNCQKIDWESHKLICGNEGESSIVDLIIKQREENVFIAFRRMFSL